MAPKDPEKKWYSKILDTVIVIASVGALIWMANWLPIFDGNEEGVEIIDTPNVVDLSNEGPIASDPPKILELIKEGESRIYDNSAFDKFSEVADRIIVKGDVEKASLVFKAIPIETDSIGETMVSITVDDESGLYRAYRQSTTRISKTKTSSLGGIFQDLENLELEVSLTDNILLATTGEEYSLTQAPNRFVNLWQSMLIQPPTIFRLMVVPMDANTGALNKLEVTQLDIKYVCKESEPDCELIRCQEQYSTYYDCLSYYFDEETADNWFENSGL